MKKLCKQIAIAFSIYSRIPMPVFIWQEEDTGHAAAFLPLIGIVIGGLEYLACRIFTRQTLFNGTFPKAAQLAGYILVPLLVTGGFHLDGFLDTEDAMRSYRPPEEKLRILKDPHIGAFAVIHLAKLAALWIFGLSLFVEKAGTGHAAALALIFPEARAMSGILAQILPHARKDGMLNRETGGSPGDLVLLAAESALCMAAVLFLNLTMFICFAAAGILSAVLYRRQMLRHFGGVTGDTIGYFLVRTETLLILILGIGTHMGWI